MNILFLADASNAHTVRWATSIATKHRVGIVTHTKNPDLDQKIRQILYTENPSQNGLLRPFLMLIQITKIAFAIRRFKPDLLHVHYLVAHPIMNALPKKIPLVASLWGSDIVPLPGKPIEKKKIEYLQRYFNRAQAVTATSPYLVRMYRKLFKDELREPEVIPFGIDLQHFTPKHLEDRKPLVVGFAKTFFAHYGFMDLLNAAAPLCKEGKIVLRIAGNGPEEEKYKAEAERLGILQHCNFLGRVSPFSMPKYYATLDIFAVPSHRESFGVGALEAMASGIPVIGTSVGGLPDLIQDGKNGLVVSPYDAKALREALEKLVADFELRKTMGENGRKMVSEQYNWNKNVASMEGLYERITEK